MGYAIRNNIFQDNDTQRYFKRFPVQVAVLFSPSDDEFSDHFADLFLHLDQMTGNELVFFAVLSPPEDWLQVARHRSWWREYEQRFGRSPFTFDNTVLAYELAQLFNVNWGSLPALIVGTNLWTSEFLTVPTGSRFIEKQLNTLTNLVKERGQPNINQIAATLEDAFGLPSTYDPASQDKLQKLDRFYEALGSIDNRSKVHRIAEQELRAAIAGIKQIYLSREATPAEPQEIHPLLEPAANQAIAELIGNLVAPFSALSYAIEDRQTAPARLALVPAGIENLEEESKINIRTALLVEKMMWEVHLQKYRKSAYDDPYYDKRRLKLDWTPTVQGLWKALELEANLSTIQAARKARGVKMPDLFALYDPGLNVNSGRVETANGRKKDINQKSTGKPEHRFLTLGDAWHVTKAMNNSQDAWHVTEAMNNSQKESFQDIIRRCLGDSFPSEVLDNWFKVIQPRNKGSHIEPMGRAEAEEINDYVLKSGLLDVLTRVKVHLKGGQ